MSIPIDDCLIHAGALGNDEAKDELLGIMRENLRLGHWSHFPCPHDPPCQKAPPEQYAAFSSQVWKVLNSEPCHMCNGTKLANDKIEPYTFSEEGFVANMVPCPACSKPAGDQTP